MNKKSIAIIPARGGSKRIPRKNIKEFSGKPMIAWSIEAAIQSGCFEQIIVSTDDQEIAAIAKSYGASVPFIRPAELSDDFTPTIPVIKHAILMAEKELETIDFACCIYATAPFLKPQYIQHAFKIITEQQRNYVFSACQLPAPAERTFKANHDGGVSMLFPEHFKTRSQDLTPTYYDAAQLYWGTRLAWIDEIPVFSENSQFIELPASCVQDFDTLEDWDLGVIKHKMLSTT